MIHHTDCGMRDFSDEEFHGRLRDETGVEPSWDAKEYSELEIDVRQSVERIKASPFIPEKDSVRGFVYDVRTGALDEVA